MSPSWNQRRVTDTPLAWDPPFPLVVFWAGQDDASKNTAKKLQRHGLIHLVESPRELPRRSVLLDPMSKKALSREDLPLIRAHGLAAVDCSWERVVETYKVARKGHERRALPLLLAGNPTKYGQAFQLSTAEALAASLIILGHRDDALELMRVFPWAQSFFDVNAEPLAAYEAAATSAEIVAAQRLFVPDEDPVGDDGEE